MDAATYMVGVIVLTLLVTVGLALALIGVSMLVNKACWRVVDSYGGVKTLREFQHWHANKSKGAK